MKKPMDMSLPIERPWSVLFTKPHIEKKVSSILSKRNIENYLPLKSTAAPWWVPKKILHVPLFTSLVFVKLTDEKEIKHVKSIDGVINLLYWLGKPVELKNEEINEIKSFLYSHSNITTEKIFIGLNYITSATSTLTTANNKMSCQKVDLPTLGYRLVANDPQPEIRIISFEKSSATYNAPYSHAS